MGFVPCFFVQTSPINQAKKCLKGKIFITVGQSEATTYGVNAHETLPERQNLLCAVLSFRQLIVAVCASASNALLACGYENFAFQAFFGKLKQTLSPENLDKKNDFLTFALIFSLTIWKIHH